MRKTHLSRAETRILERYWKLGASSVREILESLREEERVCVHDRSNAGVQARTERARCAGSRGLVTRNVSSRARAPSLTSLRLARLVDSHSQEPCFPAKALLAVLFGVLLLVCIVGTIVNTAHCLVVRTSPRL